MTATEPGRTPDPAADPAPTPDAGPDVRPDVRPDPALDARSDDDRDLGWGDDLDRSERGGRDARWYEEQRPPHWE